MINWVYERTKKCVDIDEIYVATDDARIVDTVIGFGGKAIMTGECRCGTDRIYQAVCNIDCDIVVNVQGDEAAINHEDITKVISAFNDNSVVMSTLKKKIQVAEEIKDTNVVKVITNHKDDAIYFSRLPIPYCRNGNCEKQVYYRHIGLYGYRKEFLEIFVNLPKSTLENVEMLEQLRAIENGYKIRVLETENDSIGIDVPEQIPLIEDILRKEEKAV